MNELLQSLTGYLNNSPLRELSNDLLRSIPGMPPILQTIHLLGVAVLMGSVLMINLRILNLACRRQALDELMRRLFPWFFWSLPLMLLSGLPFLLARPQRYLSNPVFGIKFLALTLALVSGLLLWRWYRSNHANLLPGAIVKLTALLSAFSWILTAMAGRWIAYADYLFWPG
jgi:hypothetical protein